MVLISIENAILTGGPGNNTLDSSNSTRNTTLRGNEGNDIFITGNGSDFVFGGLGTDTYIRNLSGLGVETEVTLQNTSITIIRDPFGIPLTETDLLNSIESVQITGSNLQDVFDLGGWTAGTVTVNGGAGEDILRATVAGNVTLNDTTVTFTGGIGAIAFSSIEAAILIGSAGDDLMNASAFSGAVWLQGLGGNDTLVASKGTLLPGFSILDGGEDDDTFRFVEDGMLDSILIVGGDGVDTLSFGADAGLGIAAFLAPVTVDLASLAAQVVVPADLRLQFTDEDIENVVGGDGADTLRGNSLDNTFTGGAGADLLIDGVAGFNTLVETADATSMILTDLSLSTDGVIDTLANIQHAALTGGAGANTIDASGFTGTTILSGGSNDDTLIGGSNEDVLIGGAGNDLLRGGLSDDTYQFDVDELLGEDTIDELPGEGEDFLDFSPTETVGVTVDLSLTTQQTVHATNLRLTLLNVDTIENIFGGAQADTFTGNNLDNGFFAGGGSDIIDGGAGNNFLFEIRDANFVLTDTDLTITGVDELNVPYSETDTFTNIIGAFLFGGVGSNTIDASAFTLGAVALSGGAGNDLLIGGSGADLIEGGEGNDTLIGNEGDDDLQGGAGSDLLNGGADDDTLRGGIGNDIYFFDKSFDQGVDTIIEFIAQGYYDVIIGLGLSGVDIDLLSGAAQFFFDDTLTLVLTLTLSPGTIEDAF
jgi:Ca2+-binding RTX toxin-like protein